MKRHIGFMLGVGLCLVIQACTAMSYGPDQAEITFEDTYWKLTNITGGPLVSHGSGDLFIQFLSENNRAAGFSGCNHFTGSYTAMERKLKMGPIASTKMMCADKMTLEMAFQKAIHSAGAYKIKGDILTLETVDGKVLATFQAGEKP